MSKKRSFSVSRVLKALAIVFVLACVAIISLHWWTGSKVHHAEEAFNQVAGDSLEASLVTDVSLRVIAVSTAAEAIAWSKDEQKAVFGLVSVSANEWASEKSEAIQQILERNRSVLEEISTALNSPETGVEEVQIFPFVSQTLGPLLNASRLMAADARHALAHNEVDRAMERLSDLRILADEAYQPSRSLGVILGLSVERYIDRILRDTLVLPTPTSGTESFFERLAAFIPSADLNRTMKLTVTHETQESLDRLKESTDLPPDASLWNRMIRPVFTPIFNQLFRSASLENAANLLLSIDTPFASSQETFLAPAVPPWWQLHRRVAQFGTATSRNLIARSQATLALRQLLKASLEMRATQWPDGAFPEVRPDIQALTNPDPFSGQLLEYEVLTDGRLRLAVAGGPELLEALRIPQPRDWLDPIEFEPPATE